MARHECDSLRGWVKARELNEGDWSCLVIYNSESNLYFSLNIFDLVMLAAAWQFCYLRSADWRNASKLYFQSSSFYYCSWTKNFGAKISNRETIIMKNRKQSQISEWWISSLCMYSEYLLSYLTGEYHGRLCNYGKYIYIYFSFSYTSYSVDYDDGLVVSPTSFAGLTSRTGFNLSLSSCGWVDVSVRFNRIWVMFMPLKHLAYFWPAPVYYKYCRDFKEISNSSW